MRLSPSVTLAERSFLVIVFVKLGLAIFLSGCQLPNQASAYREKAGAFES